MDAQRHRAGNTADRQLARENRFVRADKFDLLTRESNLRMFLYVEKVLALKVSVARRFACPDSSSFDRGLDGSRAWVRRVENKRAVNIFEMAADESHHHVTHRKPRRRMPGFEKPFGHSTFLPSKKILSGVRFYVNPSSPDSISAAGFRGNRQTSQRKLL